MALQEKFIIITKDEAFQMRASVSTQFPKIIWVRPGNSSKKALLNFFDEKWEQVKFELKKGVSLV